MRIKSEGQEERHKITVMAILLASACALTYCSHAVLGVGTVFSHFFYIPIILASLWWKRKGVVVAIFLAALLIGSHIFLRLGVTTDNDYVRALVFIVIAFVVATSSERIAKSEEALRETRDYLENLLNYANAPIIVWDLEFRITRFNHAFERLAGKNAGEVLGAPLDILFPEGGREEAMAHIHRTMAGERWEVVEIPILRADGMVRIVLWNSATLYAKDGTTVIATMAQGQDITERKRAEEELRKHRDHLDELVKERTAELTVANEQLQREITERARAEAKRAYRLEMERVLSQASSLFVDPQNLDQAINEMLGDTGTALNANRAYLFKIYDDGTKMDNTHEWVAEGTTPQIENLQGLDTDIFPWWMSRLYDNEIIVAPDVIQLPSPEKEILQEQGIFSILVIPIFTHGALYGFFGFDETEQHREWESEEVGFLRNAAQILGRALERAQAQRALQRRNLELAALNAVGDVITSTLDLRTMQNLIIDKAVELLQAEAGSLWLVDQDTGELVCEITADPDAADLVGTRLPSGTGVVGAVVQEGKPIIVGEAQTDRRWYRGFDDQTAFTTRSIIAVPMVSRGRTIGAIELLNRRDGVSFTDDDERLLTAIGQQIGVAVENARLFGETRARGHQTELLLSASETAASTLDSVEVLRRVARAVARAMGADMTGAYLLDESGTVLRPVAGYHVPPERLAAFLQFQIPLKGHSLVEEAWQNKQAVFTSEAGNDPRFDAQTRQLFQATSVLLIPMIVKDEIIGGLWAVWWEEAHRFIEEELWLCEGIVRQAAVAIQNAYLFEEARRRAGQLEALSEIGRAIGSTLDLDAVLRLILERLEWVAPYDTVSLWLREGEVMRIRAAMGFEDPGAVVGLAVPIGEDRLFQELVHTRQPLIIADVQQDERLRSFAGTEWVRSWLGVPLLSKGEVVGLLTINKGESGSYTAETGKLTFAFGQQAAVAIENARLYEAVRLRERQARALYEAGQLAARLEGGLEVGLQTFFERLTGVGDFDRWWVPLLDEHGLTMQGLAGRWEDVPDEQMRRRVVLAEEPRNPVVIAIQNREMVMIDDPERDERLADLPENFRRRAGKYVTVPMASVSGERVIGALSLGRPISGRDVSTDDVDLVCTLAGQVALAIENAHLFEEARSRAEELAVLNELGQALTARLSVEQVLNEVYRQAARLVDTTNFYIALYDPDKDEVTFTIDVTEGEVRKPYTTRRAGQGLTEYIIRNRTSMLIRENLLKWQEEMGIEAVGKPSLSWLGVPLIVGDRVLGVMVVQSYTTPHLYDEHDHDLLIAIASPTAIALQNAHLFEETQRRVRELRLLHDVGLAAASGVRLEEMLQAAVEALAAELGGARVGIELLDPEGGLSRLDVSVGYSPDAVKNLHLRPGEGVTGWVAQHGESLLIPDVRLDHRYIEVGSGVRSELCLPLSTDARVIGVLNVESTQPNAFTDDDQRLLSTLANNLTVLIERARLFEEVEAARMALQQRAEALEEANVRLRELDRLKSEFLANMSHELRTPLNSVIGFSEVLIDGLVGEVTSEQEECLGNIRSSGKHLLALINDILDLSKIEAGRVELKMATFDVTGLLAEVEVTIRPLIEKKSQVLKVEQADGLPHLTADRFRVKQVLLNLLSNAHKFTLVEGRITLSCRLVDQTTMLFSVTDTGIGIKPEDQEMIFEEFRQADGSASREVTGTGLGLAISKRLVEMHGGRIWVKSEYGHGATFSLLLPLAGPPAAELRMAGEREIT